MLSAIERRMKSGNLRPKQKYHYSMTSNQEYGWDGENGGLTKQDPRYFYGCVSTPITEYAKNYVETRGINPFKVRDRVVRKIEDPAAAAPKK